MEKLPFVSKPYEIENADYHRGEKFLKFVSSSGLKNYLISPKYARYTQLNPEEKDTTALTFGSVYHDILASIANYNDMRDFDKRWFVFEPPINQRTGKSYGQDSKAYLEEKLNQRAANPGKEICSESDIKLAKIMLEELLENNRHLSWIVRDFIKMGKAERSHFCEYEDQFFKFRTDLETRTKIVDWKTIAKLEDSKEDQFSKIIINRGYHISAAFYQFFDHLITGKWRKFFWIVQEKQPPYDFMIHDSSEWTWNIYKLDGEQIAEPRIGALLFLKLLEQHIHCCDNKQWDGYSTFIEPDFRKMRIAKPRAPFWYEKNMLNFYN